MGRERGYTDAKIAQALASQGGITDGDKGDITVSGSGATWTIDNGVVSLSKMADIATASVIYRKTAGTGAPEVQTIATLKTDLGLTGTNSGDQTSIVGITGTKAQFDTACTDGNFLYSGDITQYTDEMAQDAVGGILTDTATIDFTYDDAGGQITASVKSSSITESMLTLADNTTANVSISAHGFAPKAPNDTTKYLCGDGTWAVPPGSGGDVVGPASSTDNAITRFDSTTGKLVQNSTVTINDAGEMILAAGGTVDAPVKFQSGTNLTSAEAGAVEFDGKVFYSTPVNSARGVSPSTMFAIVPSGGFGLSTSSGVQSCFPSTSDVWTLEGSTTYFFEGMYSIQKSTNAVTTAMAFALGGGASVTSIRYFVQAHNVAVNSASTGVTTGVVDQVSSTVVTASSAAFTQIRFSGIIRMNAGGTVTPQINFSGTAAGTPTMLAGSFIMFTPLGTNTVEKVGNVA